MPKLLERYGIRFHFYSHEPDEPPHVHATKGRADAKIWLDPVRMADAGRFNSADEKRIVNVVTEHRTEFLEKWHDYFG